MDEMKPDISICMITYNHAPYIAKAIEGVLMQKTRYSFQLVISDDASTDGTRDICNLYQQKHPDVIKLLPEGKNIGMAENYIRALEHCSGNFIALCEGDDYWTSPHKLQMQVEFLQSNLNYCLVFHDVQIDKKNGRGKSSVLDVPQSSDLGYLLSSASYIYTPSVVFKNNGKRYIDLIKKCSGSPFLDFITYVSIAREGGLLKFIPEKLAAYRVHGNGAWTSLNHQQAAEKLSKGLEILYEHLNEDEQSFLRTRYLLLLEDYYSNSFYFNYQCNERLFKNTVFNIDEYVVRFIKSNFHKRQKVSHYVTSVPIGLLSSAIIKKVQRKIL